MTLDPPPDETPEARPAHAARDASIEDAWRALPVDRPPPDFARRVEARLDAIRRRRLIAAGVATLGVAAGALLLVWSPPTPRDGHVEVTRRTTLTLPAYGRAVAEPGAVLSWRADGGAMRVEQRAGEVFYRVDDGPFVVATPAGDVAVQGTCFSVEVEPMSPQLKAGALGALVGVAATVAVYEGSVALRNDRGEVALAAGEQGRLAPDAPPRRSDGERAALAPVPPVPPVPPAPPAPPPPVRRVGRLAAPAEPPVEVIDPDAPEAADELASLRDEVASLRRALDAERAMRADTEGEPVAFPEDLPAHFRETALRQSFAAALGEAGLDGEIKSIDCSEYPCIVYGDLKNPDERALDTLMETEAMTAYKGADNSTSAWGNRTRERDAAEERHTFFGVALMPEDTMKDSALRDEIGKRLRFRNQQAFDAFRPEIEPPPE